LEWQFLVEKVARSYARACRHVEREDCEQELFAHLLTPSAQAAVESADDPEAYVAFVLWCRAWAYEREMRRQGRIYVGDQYFYSAREVKRALPVALRWRFEDKVPEVQGDPGELIGRGNTDPAEGNTLQATVQDVLAAFDGLSERDQYLLIENDFREVSLRELAHGPRRDWFSQGAGPCGSTGPCRPCATAEKAHERAINRLVEQLGGSRRREADEHDGPGARRVISNAEARALTE
jgi:hypothetical protein